MSYEVRFAGYYAMSFGSPYEHVIPGLVRWFSYSTELDCDIEDWRDRAS